MDKKNADSLDSAKQYAFRLLGYRQRSRMEIVEKLKKKGVPAGITADVIKALERTGCLDDERFARDFIESRLIANPAGRKYFKAELSKKNVAGETVEKVLDEVLPADREYEAAYNTALKIFSRYSRLDEKARLKKVYGHLIRKGFSGETAGDILSRLGDEYREDEN